MAVSNDEPSASIAYKKMSKTKNNNCDWEVLIQPNGDSSFKKSDRPNFTLRTLLCMFFVLTFVAFITWVMIFSPSNYDPNPSCYVDEDCRYLNNVDKIVLTVSERENYTCFDKNSCAPLFEKMERDGYGTKYNFVVGSEFPIYVPIRSGFHCSINGSADTLHINIIRHNHSIEHFLEEVNRVAEVIVNGLNCEIISTNFTITDVLEEHFQLDPEHHVELHTNGSEISHSKHHSFFNYVAQVKSKVSKSEVTKHCNTAGLFHTGMMEEAFKTSNGSENCPEYQPANIVIVNAEIRSNFNYTRCLDDGAQYNFISGLDSKIYKGLGLKCGTKFNIFKIYVYNTKYEDATVFDFLKNEINCQTILQDFTFVLKCQDHCKQAECSNITQMSWHSAFHEFKTSKSQWIENDYDCSFSFPQWSGESEETGVEVHHLAVVEPTGFTSGDSNADKQTQIEDITTSSTQLTWPHWADERDDYDYADDYF